MSKIARMTQVECASLAEKIAKGEVYTSEQVPARTFLPVALGAFDGWSGEELMEIGLIWEELSKAGPWSFNGMPGFFSMNVVHADDAKIVFDMLEALEKEKEEDK